MKVEWNTVLSVDYLSSINCWATLDDLQKVLPFPADKFTQVLLNAHNHIFWPIFLSATFYDLKVTFGYIGESPENFMSKYTQEV